MPQPKREAKKSNGRGELIIIGGHEEKQDNPEILRTVAGRGNGGLLLVATLASSVAKEQWQTYRTVFTQLGVKKVEQLDLETRADSEDDERAALLRKAQAVFFTGGDQLRITSSFGGSPLCNIMRERYGN